MRGCGVPPANRWSITFGGGRSTSAYRDEINVQIPANCERLLSRQLHSRVQACRWLLFPTFTFLTSPGVLTVHTRFASLPSQPILTSLDSTDRG